MKLNVILFVLGICVGLIFYNKVFDVGSDKKSSEIIRQIDTVFSERTHYIKDTVIVKQKIVVDRFIEDVKIVDSVFKDTSVENKQKLFDSVYPGNLYDSFKIIDATSSQAHDAIEAKYLQQRDSSLLDICQDNVKQCDKSLETVKTKIDTLKQLIPVENSRWKAIGITTSITSGLLVLLYFLR